MEEETPRTLRFKYTNYRGEFGCREVVPRRIWYGATEWHRDPQWLLEAFDVEKQESRCFALRDIDCFVDEALEDLVDARTKSGQRSTVHQIIGQLGPNIRRISRISHVLSRAK